MAIHGGDGGAHATRSTCTHSEMIFRWRGALNESDINDRRTSNQSCAPASGLHATIACKTRSLPKGLIRFPTEQRQRRRRGRRSSSIYLYAMYDDSAAYRADLFFFTPERFQFREHNSYQATVLECFFFVFLLAGCCPIAFKSIRVALIPRYGRSSYIIA